MSPQTRFHTALDIGAMSCLTIGPAFVPAFRAIRHSLEQRARPLRSFEKSYPVVPHATHSTLLFRRQDFSKAASVGSSAVLGIDFLATREEAAADVWVVGVLRRRIDGEAVLMLGVL